METSNLNTISASVEAQLIKDCIDLLHHEDLFVTALVFDGTFSNQSTGTQLGCIMDLSNIQTWLPHPQIPNAKVCVIFNVCHMMKLMQNLLCDQNVICYEENATKQRIKWHYIEALNSVQEDLGLSLANGLKKQHILFTKHKMNVRIAAQHLALPLEGLLTCYKSKLIFQSLRVVRQQHTS